MKVILIGFPGSGKSTQAKKVSEFFDLPYIGTGELVRTSLETCLKEYKESVSEGFLLPDDIVFKIVSDRIFEFGLDNGFVMEGFPRTVEQAQLLDRFLREKCSVLDFVLNLTIGSDTINSRVLNRHQCKYCGSIVEYNAILINNSCPVCKKYDAYRADDTRESLERRIELFQNKSYPLIEYYLSKNILWNIDASGTIDQVFRSISLLLKTESRSLRQI